MLKSLLIHNNNVPYLENFTVALPFNSTSGDIDKYISEQIIPDMTTCDFDIIYIKDSLSVNYLELCGLRMAYHIRLSQELGEKRFVPIVILSDVDSHVLNKLNPTANILFTKNIFIGANNKETIEYFNNQNIKNMSIEEYKKEFLDKIHVEQPKDYLTHHSIANEWSIYRWAKYLEVNTDDVLEIEKKISSMLYFKYLIVKFPIRKSLLGKHMQTPKEEGKILYIDDEWEKGWSSILKKLYPSLSVVEEIYKDKSIEQIIEFVINKVNIENPDVVILDMRLHEDDFKDDIPLDELSGIQIFQKIKEINPGIQCVILTASSNSLLLEELQSYDTNILSYIKKEHPDDVTITTQGNINKLINKINKGFEKKDLKEIWKIKKNIARLLGTKETWDQNPFAQYIDDIEQYKDNLGKLKRENEHIFDILNSEKKNKFNYALISLATSIDTLQDIFIEEEWDRDSREKRYYYLGDYINNTINNLPGKIEYILRKSGSQRKYPKLKSLNKRRNDYVHFKPKYDDPTIKDIKDWFQMYYEIVNKIKNPKTIKRRKEKQLGSIDLSAIIK